MDMINNDNKNELSPIRSVIIRMSNKIGRPRSGKPRFFIPVWLQTELNDTKSCYKLIKTMAKFDSTIQTSLQQRTNTRNVRFRNSLRCSIYLINQIMLLWPYLPPTQHHSKGLFTWSWETPGRWGNPPRWCNPPVHIISYFILITFR